MSTPGESWWINCIRLDQTPERIDELLEALWAHTYPVALDLETTSCNPKKRSPVSHAKPWCLTLAWGRPYRTAFVRVGQKTFCRAIRTWLESDMPKVGANLWNFDIHALANVGIQLNGILGDTVRMSRLLAPDDLNHDLKTWGKRLGWEVRSLEEVSCRPKPGALSKKGDRQNVSWARTELIPIDELWDSYPGRREALVRYAVQDAVMALDVYWHLRGKLEEVLW